MNRMIQDASLLEQNIPPASEGFEERTMAMLRELAAREPASPTPRRKFSLGFALGLVAVLLAATALAVGLQWSARHRTIMAAREAVMAQYGLTQETLAMFQQNVTQEGNRWEIVYVPVKFNAEAMGQYTVVIEGDGKPQVSWTHDNAAPEDKEGFASGVWKQKELELALQVDRKQRDNYAAAQEQNVDLLTLEERAAVDRPLAEAKEQGLESFVMHIAPSDTDLQPEEALKLAKEAVVEKFGVSMARLEGLQVTQSFVKYAENEEPNYRFWLTRGEGEPTEGAEMFMVSLFSPSGKVESCGWWIEPQYRTLPEGPLQGYEEAVVEFMQEGAFEWLSPEGKAELGARIMEAGYGDLIGNRAYLAPMRGDISQEAAVASATGMLEEKYGFTQDTLALFRASASLQGLEGARAWVVDYSPVPSVDPRESWWDDTQEEKLGHYSVQVDPVTGKAVSCVWDLQELWDDKNYTRETWGQAEVYGAKLLPWVQELLEARKPLMQKDVLSLEERAAHDQLFRDAGFDPSRFLNGMPGKGDMPMEEALALGRQALQNEFGLSMEALVNAPMDVYFFVGKPGQHEWFFWIFPDGEDCSVTVNAADGTIIRTDYATVGNG